MAPTDEELWIESLYSTEDGGHLAPGWWEWLHELYVSRGPLEVNEAEALAESVMHDRAERASVLVAADATATLGESVEVATLRNDWGLRVIVDGQDVGGVGLMSMGVEELAAEVADAAQGAIMDDSRVWPECPHHNAGLHAELDDGQAAWVCRLGNHRVALIGDLADASSRSGKAAKRRARRLRKR